MVVWGTRNISLCVCFPLRSLEEMPVSGDDQRLSGNLDDGHNLDNLAIFREYRPFLRGWFQIAALI